MTKTVQYILMNTLTPGESPAVAPGWSWQASDLHEDAQVDQKACPPGLAAGEVPWLHLGQHAAAAGDGQPGVAGP